MNGYYTVAVCLTCLGFILSVVSYMAWRADR